MKKDTLNAMLQHTVQNAVAYLLMKTIFCKDIKQSFTVYRKHLWTELMYDSSRLTAFSPEWRQGWFKMTDWSSVGTKDRDHQTHWYLLQGRLLPFFPLFHINMAKTKQNDQHVTGIKSHCLIHSGMLWRCSCDNRPGPAKYPNGTAQNSPGKGNKGWSVREALPGERCLEPRG